MLGGGGELAGTRCLVTGGTGFVGGRLAELLVSVHGARVRVLARDLARAARVARRPVELVHGDVTDAERVREAARGCDVVFHCAYGNRGTPDEMHHVDVQGTENVLSAALAEGARVVQVSTLSVYGITRDGDLDEASPRRPGGERYAESKLAAEGLTLAYARERGLPATVVQPCVVYGPSGPGWTVRILDEMRRGRVLLVDGGEGLCNAVYVDDLADALVAAAVRPEAVGEVFLVSGAGPVTWRDFYASYERMLGVRATAALDAGEAVTRWHAKHGRKGLVRESLALLREAPLRRRVRATREVDVLVRAGRVFVPQGVRRSLSARLHGAPSTPRVDDDPRPIHLLPPRAVRFFASRTRVRIDKARELLGYRPRHDLALGMRRTAAWAAWARLLGRCP